MTVTTAAVPAAAQPAGPRQRPDRMTRRWRLPVAIAAVVLFGGLVIALLAPAASPGAGYLDPASTQGTGARALADILAERGTRVIRVTSAAAAVATGARVIVVTSPGLLTSEQLGLLAVTNARLLLVAPGEDTLLTLAPGVNAAGRLPAGPVQPACRLPAATLAGSADLGGIRLRLDPGYAGTQCYRAGGTAFLISYSPQLTILGTGAPLENQNLAALGNCALALNLLGSGGKIAWLVPALPAAASTGSGSFWRLVPAGAYLVAAELGVAVLLTAAWRARRLGPLVAEPLPVVVRAAETTEGHARLYKASRSRGQAAQALRAAVAARLIRALGLPADAGTEIIAAEVAARTSLSQGQARQLLSGLAPATDADLVRLATELDAMEGEVRAR
jgi:Domain of unknown function (DUF4350)